MLSEKIKEVIQTKPGVLEDLTSFETAQELLPIETGCCIDYKKLKRLEL